MRAVHQLLGKGGAPWSQNIFLRDDEVKICSLSLIISHMPAPAIVQGALWRVVGANKNVPVVWRRVGISSYFMKKFLCTCSYPGKISEKPSRRPGGNLDSSRKWKNFSFMPRFTPQLLISLSNSTGDKSRRAWARMLYCFPQLFCWLYIYIYIMSHHYISWLHR